MHERAFHHMKNAFSRTSCAIHRSPPAGVRPGLIDVPDFADDAVGDKISLAEQNSLIRRTGETGASLADVLENGGLTYESLRYETYCELPRKCLEPLATLDSLPRETDAIPAVSFFAGAGGFDAGCEHAGFDTVASIECNEVFCGTLRANSPRKAVIGPPHFSGDVRRREELAEVLAGLGVKEGFPGMFHGGPPCQPFSVAANQRFCKSGDNFKRTGFDDAEKGTLIFDYIWFIRMFRPRVFLIENVAGIMACDSDGRIRRALDDLAGAGYDIAAPRLFNAAHHGVPQNRMRWIIAGARTGRKPDFPVPDREPAPCGSVFLRDVEGAENHVTREHAAGSVARYMKLAYGERDKMGRVDRLDPRLPSKTVIAGGARGGGRSHLHPFTPRTLSVRECARLQTFPDGHVFTGATARQFTQVGNAVPPLFAFRLALAVKRSVV